MKRTLVAMAVLGLAVSSVGVASAKPGNGAQKSGLTPASGLAPVLCDTADPADAGQQTANGFVVLNAPGKPVNRGNSGKTGGPHKLVGEVALKNVDKGTYDVWLSGAAGDCGDNVGQIVIFSDGGNGNLSFQDTGKGAGTWHVVITEAVIDPALGIGEQKFASAPVELR